MTQKPSLYEAVRAYETQRASLENVQMALDNAENGLGSALVKYKREIPNLVDMALGFSQELKKIDEMVNERFLPHFHQLKRYWSNEQIEKFDDFIKMVGSDFIDDDVRAVKGGIVRPKERGIAIIPYRNLIASGYLTLASLSFVVVGAPPIILLGGIVGAYAIWDCYEVENPFTKVGDECVRKAKNMKSQLLQYV